MLVILYGVSCVEKTTLISELIEKHAWKAINCYLTRDIRSDDIARIKITKENFLILERQRFFLATNRHFNVWHGMPLPEIKNATFNKTQIFVLDFMLKKQISTAIFQT